jgi:hypothetical protein
MNKRTKKGHRYRGMMIALTAVLCLLVTACGIGDTDEGSDESDEPSSAQPTVQGPGTDASDQDNGSPESPANIDLSSPDAAGTPLQTDDQVGPSPVSGDATPEDSAVLVPGLATSTPVDDATPAVDQPPTGDGTTGAPPPAQGGSSAGTPAAGEATPTPAAATGSTPDAELGTAVAGREISVVDGCEVEDVPAFTGATSTYRVNSELNFRSGPGTDCELIGQAPLDVSTVVEVIGGPVTRQGEDGIEWVQVRVGEETGWVALEFLDVTE